MWLLSHVCFEIGNCISCKSYNLKQNLVDKSLILNFPHCFLTIQVLNYRLWYGWNHSVQSKTKQRRQQKLETEMLLVVLRKPSFHGSFACCMKLTGIYAQWKVQFMLQRWLNASHIKRVRTNCFLLSHPDPPHETGVTWITAFTESATILMRQEKVGLHVFRGMSAVLHAKPHMTALRYMWAIPVHKILKLQRYKDGKSFSIPEKKINFTLLCLSPGSKKKPLTEIQSQSVRKQK